MTWEAKGINMRMTATPVMTLWKLNVRPATHTVWAIWFILHSLFEPFEDLNTRQFETMRKLYFQSPWFSSPTECRQSWSFHSPVETSSISSKEIKNASCIQNNHLNNHMINTDIKSVCDSLPWSSWPCTRRASCLSLSPTLPHISPQTPETPYKEEGGLIQSELQVTCCITADPENSRGTLIITRWVNLP